MRSEPNTRSLAHKVEPEPPSQNNFLLGLMQNDKIMIMIQTVTVISNILAIYIFLNSKNAYAFEYLIRPIHLSLDKLV